MSVIRRRTLQGAPYSDGALSLKDFGGSIYDSGEEEDDLSDKELAEEDIDEFDDQEDGSQIHTLKPANASDQVKARFLSNL